MRWKSIKTVMIVILLGVNLWLVYLLFGSYVARTYVGQDVLRNTVEILARDGIRLTVDQLDPKKREAAIYAASMPADYDSRIAALFSGTSVNESFPTPTGVSMLAANGDRISLSDPFGITYLASGQSRDTVAIIAEFAARSGETLSPGERGLRPLRQTLEALLEGERGNVTTVSPKLCFDAAYRFGDYTLMRCSQQVDGKPLGGHVVDCLFDRDGRLLWLDGTWILLTPSRTYSAPLYDQINILFIERDSIVGAEAPTALTLSSMQPCYILSRATDAETGERTVYYSPAWQIAYTDGATRIYSAVTGELAE